MLEKQSLKNGLEPVAAGVFHLKIVFVNAYFVDTPENALGDAPATMNQDSWISNITEERQFNRPPAPFTTDWTAARRSVETPAKLEPNVVAAGHGQPISGANTAERLKNFARNFTAPARGRYVRQPAIANETGIVALPPPVADPVRKALIGAAVLAGGAVAFGLFKRRRVASYKSTQTKSAV